jgi:hypothetical protein
MLPCNLARTYLWYKESSIFDSKNLGDIESIRITRKPKKKEPITKDKGIIRRGFKDRTKFFISHAIAKFFLYPKIMKDKNSPALPNPQIAKGKIKPKIAIDIRSGIRP